MDGDVDADKDSDGTEPMTAEEYKDGLRAVQVCRTGLWGASAGGACVCAACRGVPASAPPPPQMAPTHEQTSLSGTHPIGGC